MNRFAGLLSGSVFLKSKPDFQIDDDIVIHFRGYIVNGKQIIAQAKSRGEPLTVDSDVGVLYLAYRIFGDNLQSSLYGEFSASIYDRKNAKLLLTHDALGIVPMFYLCTEDCIHFASYLEDIVAAKPTLDIDEEYVADYLCRGTISGSRTPYHGISRLLPGQSLVWQAGSPKLRKIWDITQIEQFRFESDIEYVERLQTLIKEGVDGALKHKGKVWAELSGGLDSSTITSLAALSTEKSIEAVSIVHTESKHSDESEWMKEVVRHYNIPWHTLDGDETKPFCELPQEFCAEPISAFPDAGLFRKYKLLAQSSDVQVILSGHGGDQVFFAGTNRPYHLNDLLPFKILQFVRGLRKWRSNSSESRSLLFYFIHSVLQPMIRYRSGKSLFSSGATTVPTWINPEYALDMNLHDRALTQCAPRANSTAQQYLIEMIWSSSFTNVGQPQQPFEFRYPLLFRPLVEFMLGLPWEQRLNPHGDRYLQRLSMKGVLPERVRRRSGKGDPFQVETVGLGSDNPWIPLLLESPRVVRNGYVTTGLWEESVLQTKFGRIDSMRHFVATASLEIWLRQIESKVYLECESPYMC